MFFLPYLHSQNFRVHKKNVFSKSEVKFFCISWSFYTGVYPNSLFKTKCITILPFMRHPSPMHWGNSQYLNMLLNFSLCKIIHKSLAMIKLLLGFVSNWKHFYLLYRCSSLTRHWLSEVKQNFLCFGFIRTSCYLDDLSSNCCMSSLST